MTTTTTTMTPERQAAIDAGLARIKARCPKVEREPVFGPNGPKTHYERVLASRRNLNRDQWAWNKHLGR